MPEKLGSQAKSRIWHSCTLSYILRTPSIKKHRQPNKPPALLPSYQPKQAACKLPSERLNLKKDAVYTSSRLFLTHKKHALKLGNYNTGRHRDGSWGITGKRKSTRRRKVLVPDVSSRSNESFIRVNKWTFKKTQNSNSKKLFWENKVQGLEWIRG